MIVGLTHPVARAICIAVLCLAVGPSCAAEQRRARASGEAASGLERIDMTVGGQPRSFLIRVPAAAQDNRAPAAVFVFHGGEGDGDKANRMSAMAAEADRRGFVAVFPNGGRNGSEPWNDGRQTTKSDKDDVAFVLAIIDRLATDHRVDRSRIFATGASNGGMFVYRLACEATGSFAAFAAVIANLPADLAPVCRPSAAPPMMIIAGTEDPLMPPAGGEIKSSRLLGLGRGGTVISTAQTVAFWARADGCAAEPAVSPLPDTADDGTTVVRHQYSGCKNNADVVFYEIKGGGHTWPGTSLAGAARFTGKTSRDINATAVIVDFFATHGL